MRDAAYNRLEPPLPTFHPTANIGCGPEFKVPSPRCFHISIRQIRHPYLRNSQTSHSARICDLLSNVPKSAYAVLTTRTEIASHPAHATSTLVQSSVHNRPIQEGYPSSCDATKTFNDGFSLGQGFGRCRARWSEQGPKKRFLEICIWCIENGRCFSPQSFYA